MSPVSFANKLSGRNALSMLLIGIGVAVLVGLLGLFRFTPISRLDNAFLDSFIEYFASGKPAPNTVVIDIDEVSLSAVGQWPWPRYRVASLIQQIAAEKPAAIALDILFPEADRSSLASIQQTFKRDFGVDLSFIGVPSGLLDNDGYLGHEIARSRVVGSSYFYFDHVSRSDGPPRPGLAFDGRTDLLALHVASGVLANAGVIAAQTQVSGFVNSQRDEDGVLRKLPLLINHEGVIHPHLSLAAVMSSIGVSSGSIESHGGALRLRVGNHRIPIDEAGYATLRFNGRPHLYEAVSAVDVLNGNLPQRLLRGKIVFIGTSAVGLNDIHHTAVDARFPGLKVQSVMAENILDDNFASTPSWAPASTFAACILVGALMAAIFVVGSGIYPFVLGSGLVCAAVLSISGALYAHAGLLVSPGAPILVVSTLFVVFFAIRFAIEKRQAYAWLKQLENARQVTIESMAAVAETRDPETGAHIKRTQNYVRAIAEELRRANHYPDILSKQFIDLLFISAPLHDIGKVGVPDHILLKRGRLTPEEMQSMKQHAEFGRKVIFSTAQRIEGDNFLVIAGDIAATHHEKWDGTGYPRGLAGQAIPLAGRIMAVADIYDALISRRCYKEPFTHEYAMTLMQEGRGKTFDPVVLDAFFNIEDTIKEIAANFKDEADGAEDSWFEGPVAVAMG